jgi:hypothetical protein
MKLTYNDYVDILNFYNIDANKLKKKDVKTKAENILATKLCKCIKSIKKRKTMRNVNESRAIAICNESVIRKKGLKTFKFKCKNKAQFFPKKGTRKIIIIKTP